MLISRRALTAMLASTPAWPRAASAQTDPMAATYEAAKKEGALSWYSGVMDQPICDRVCQAFSTKYPGISTSSVKTTSQVAFQRVLQDTKAGQPQCDAFTTTDVSHMSFLKSKGLLLHADAPSEASISKVFQHVDPDGFFYTTFVGLVTLLYNTDHVKPEDAPKNWTDLADPRWKSKVAFGSPAYSGMVGVWTVAMAQLYGWDYYTKLSKLDPQIGRSIDDAVTVLNSGERAVGICAVSTALRSQAKGNPIGIVYPTDGTVAVVTPSAVIKGSKNPNAGKLFVNFMLGKEYAAIMAADFDQPVRDDVAPAKGAKPLSDIKILSPSPADIEKQLRPNIDKWRDTFGM